MSDKAAEFNHEELKEQFNDFMDKANDFVNDIKEGLKDIEKE